MLVRSASCDCVVNVRREQFLATILCRSVDRNLARARALLFAVLSRDGNLKVCWKNCGNAYLDDNAPQLAALCYKRAILCDYDYGDAWYDLGIACTTLRLEQEAKMCYRRAVDINFADTDALNNLGLLFYREQQNDVALAMFEAAVCQKPGYPDLLANKCLCLASMNRKEEAYVEYIKGLADALVPTNTMLNNFVILLFGMGRFEEMKHAALKLIRMKPSSYRAWSHLGTALRSLEDFEQATIAFKSSVKLEPHYLEGWTYLAAVCGRRGLHAEATAISATVQSFFHEPHQVAQGLFYCLTSFANHVVDNRQYD